MDLYFIAMLLQISFSVGFVFFVVYCTGVYKVYMFVWFFSYMYETMPEEGN